MCDCCPKRSIADRAAVLRAAEFYGACNPKFTASVMYDPHMDAVVYTLYRGHSRIQKFLWTLGLRFVRVHNILQHDIDRQMDDTSRGPMRAIVVMQL